MAWQLRLVRTSVSMLGLPAFSLKRGYSQPAHSTKSFCFLHNVFGFFHSGSPGLINRGFLILGQKKTPEPRGAGESNLTPMQLQKQLFNYLYNFTASRKKGFGHVSPCSQWQFVYLSIIQSLVDHLGCFPRGFGIQQYTTSVHVANNIQLRRGNCESLDKCSNTICVGGIPISTQLHIPFDECLHSEWCHNGVANRLAACIGYPPTLASDNNSNITEWRGNIATYIDLGIHIGRHLPTLVPISIASKVARALVNFPRAVCEIMTSATVQ